MCKICIARDLENAQKRIADLEKQLAEQMKRAETAEKWHLNATGWADEEKMRAEAAEKRVAELQALVDAAIAALKHLGPCPNCRRPWGAHGTGCRIGYLELAAKDPR